MVSARETVEAKVSSTPVVVYSKSYCPYCTKTKALLQSLNVTFEAIELDQVADGDDLQDALKDITGQSTVPNTFIGGSSVGGNSDVQKLNNNGELLSRLQSVGAV
jgi:glutaredoxin 3